MEWCIGCVLYIVTAVVVVAIVKWAFMMVF